MKSLLRELGIGSRVKACQLKVSFSWYYKKKLCLNCNLNQSYQVSKKKKTFFNITLDWFSQEFSRVKLRKTVESLQARKSDSFKVIFSCFTENFRQKQYFSQLWSHSGKINGWGGGLQAMGDLKTIELNILFNEREKWAPSRNFTYDFNNNYFFYFTPFCHFYGTWRFTVIFWLRKWTCFSCSTIVFCLMIFVSKCTFLV